MAPCLSSLACTCSLTCEDKRLKAQSSEVELNQALCTLTVFLGLNSEKGKSSVCFFGFHIAKWNSLLSGVRLTIHELVSAGDFLWDHKFLPLYVSDEETRVQIRQAPRTGCPTYRTSEPRWKHELCHSLNPHFSGLAIILSRLIFPTMLYFSQFSLSWGNKWLHIKTIIIIITIRLIYIYK